MIKSKEKWDFIWSLDKNKLKLDYESRSVPELARYYRISKKWIISALEYYGINQHNRSETAQLKSVRDRYKNTCLEKYSVDNVFKLDSVRANCTSPEARMKAVIATKTNNLEKYGVESTNQVPDIVKKQQLSNLENWDKNHDTRLNKYKETSLKKYNVENYTQLESWKSWYHENSDEFKRKEIETKKKNHTTSSSEPEEIYYKLLCDKYGEHDVIRQYKESRYPFFCDFYVKSLDLFIELNFFWCHGGHEFNPNSPQDLEKLAEWQEKAKTNDYYLRAINCWTVSDPLKIKTAKDNNLNYIYIYDYDKNNYKKGWNLCI